MIIFLSHSAVICAALTQLLNIPRLNVLEIEFLGYKIIYREAMATLFSGGCTGGFVCSD
jgi:hypothetical protein